MHHHSLPIKRTKRMIRQSDVTFLRLVYSYSLPGAPETRTLSRRTHTGPFTPLARTVVAATFACPAVSPHEHAYVSQYLSDGNTISGPHSTSTSRTINRSVFNRSLTCQIHQKNRNIRETKYTRQQRVSHRSKWAVHQETDFRPQSVRSHTVLRASFHNCVLGFRQQTTCVQQYRIWDIPSRNRIGQWVSSHMKT
jgi:hypothetical protein